MASADLAFDVIARDRASKTFHDVGKQSDSLGGKLGDFAKKGAAAVAAFALAGAAAAAALAAAGSQFSLEKSKADALLAGQVGAGPAQAKELGKVTGALYADGWAESISQAADAVRASIENQLIPADAGAAAIQAISTRTAALAVQMGEDFSRVGAAISTMLRTGVAKDAAQAFDLLTVATQKGVNKSQDLLDTMTEYSVQFQSLGIDGPKALGLIVQALRAGARNSDVAADAIKEFAIRSKDGSALSAKAFQTLGLDAKKMFDIFARGGPEADAAMKLVVDRLKVMKNPAEQAATAVALFGTKAEDLQASLFAFDPSTAVKALGDVTGASDKFIESQTSAGQRVDKMWRDTLNALDKKLGPAIVKILDKFDEWSNDPEIQAWLANLEAEISKIAEEILPLLEGAWTFFMDSVRDNKDDIGAVIKGLVVAFGLLLAAILALGAVSVKAAALMKESWRATFNAVTGHMGFFVAAAAKAFGWVPELGPKLKKAAEDFQNFRDSVNAALDGVRDKTVKVNVTGSGTRFTMGGTIPFGGGFQEMAHGGPVIKGRPVIVGDGGGPELFVPDQNGMILPSAPSGAAAMGGGQVIELRATGFGSGLDRLFLSWLQGALRGNPGVRLTTA